MKNTQILKLALSFTFFVLGGTCIGQTCANNTLTLTLNFDNNPQDVIWEIKNTHLQVLDSGSGYGSQAPNSSLPITINNLPSGDYVFVIYDMAGDGGTAYTLGDGSAIIVSGTANYFSTLETFCSGASNGYVFDTTAPTAPTNFTASNITQTEVNLNWTAATDANGIFLQGLFINGQLAINMGAGTSLYVNQLQPNTNYGMVMIARDPTGNFSALSNPQNFNTLPSQSTSLLNAGFFENGWDGWTDGGANCARVNNSNVSYENNRSVRLRNNGSSANMTLSNVQMDAYDVVEFSFYVRPGGMDIGETFDVTYYNGSSWQHLATYQRGPDFSNGRYYRVDIIMNKNDYTFSNNAKFRIQNNANENRDKIFVDQTSLVGKIGLATPSSENFTYIGRANTQNNVVAYAEEKDVLATSKATLFPNPVVSTFSIRSEVEISSVQIFNTYNENVATFQKQLDTYNVEMLPKGLYFVTVQYVDSHTETFRFLK